MKIVNKWINNCTLPYHERISTDWITTEGQGYSETCSHSEKCIKSRSVTRDHRTGLQVVRADQTGLNRTQTSKKFGSTRIKNRETGGPWIPDRNEIWWMLCILLRTIKGRMLWCVFVFYHFAFRFLPLNLLPHRTGLLSVEIQISHLFSTGIRDLVLFASFSCAWNVN